MKLVGYIFVFVLVIIFNFSVKANNSADSISLKLKQFYSRLSSRNEHNLNLISLEKNVMKRNDLGESAIVEIYSSCSIFYDNLFLMRDRITKLDTSSVNRFDSTIKIISDYFDVFSLRLKHGIQTKHSDFAIDSVIHYYNSQLRDEIWKYEHNWLIEKIHFYRQSSKTLLPTCDGALKQILFDEISKIDNDQ